MARTIKPFRATYYNPAKIEESGDVICPPYDVISKEQLKTLREKSAYNYSHILIADDGDYQRPAALLDKFIKEGILIDNPDECFYLYQQAFRAEGETIQRFGILSLLKMDKKDIFPHENTLSGPKEDRKKMITAVKANLSPIFIIADKEIQALKDIHAIYSKKEPFFRFKDADGNDNLVWQINDKEHIEQISREFEKSGLVIADGHHRFEISYNYFKKHKNEFKDLDYILAYVTDCQSGLRVLPTHRIMNVTAVDRDFFSKLEPYFNISRVSQAVLAGKMRQQKAFCLGIYRKGNFYFLDLKKPEVLDTIGNKAYKEIDTYVFHELFLPLFEPKGPIEYSHTIDEARKLAGEDKTAFIVRAVSLDSLLKVSSRGFKLPQKSTYFYPKVMSGVVLRRFAKH